MERLLTQGEAAALLGISISTLSQMRYAGTGPEFLRVSPRRVRYLESALVAYLATTTARSTADPIRRVTRTA